MSSLPKLIICKKRILDAKGHYRYYGAGDYMKFPRGKAPIVQLGEETCYNKQGLLYPNLVVHTEKQFVEFLRNYFGYGEYRIIASYGGKFFTFWKGEINEEGWVFHQLEYDKSGIAELQKELSDAQNENDNDMAQFITEMIGEEKQDAKKQKAKKRYGVEPFLRPSSRRGSFNLWTDPDGAFEQKSQFERKRNFNLDNMSLDEINEV